jgi:FkbM family methyltransferase
MVRAVRGRTAAAFYRNVLERGDLAFDIGANHGVQVRRMLRQGARVVALEPQPGLARELQRRFRGVVVLEAAAGSEPGVADLATSSRSDQYATLNPDWPDASREPTGTWDGRARVSVVTVDSLIKEYGRPKLLKVDTEGFDNEVLAGLNTAVPHVLFEVHALAPEVARQCLDRLAKLGEYEFRLMAEEHWTFSKPLSADQVLRELPAWGDVHARLLDP